MCGYRIWGLVAGFVGYYLTGFFINFFGINVSLEEAKNWGLVVGIAIYLVPLVLPWAIKKISPPEQNYQQQNITLKKEIWVKISNILESDCRTKGQEWIQWGDKIIGHINKITDQTASPDDNVTISFYEKNLKTLKNIIERQV